MKLPSKPLKGHGDKIKVRREEKIYFKVLVFFFGKTNIPDSVTQEKVFKT